jgi:para-aminobenzoate synthetase component I
VIERGPVNFRLTCPVALSYPFWQYANMFAAAEQSFLLDSGMDPERLGGFSFLGGNPSAVLRAWRAKDRPNLEQKQGSLFSLELRRRLSPGGSVLASDSSAATPEVKYGEPFAALRDLHQQYFPHADLQQVHHEQCGPFSSGLVGGFGYALGHAIENLEDTATDDLQFPDMVFMVVDEVLAMDHQTGTVWLTITGRGNSTAAAQIQATRNQTIFLERINQFEGSSGKGVLPAQAIDQQARNLPARDDTADSPRNAFSIPLEAHFDRAAYKSAVQQCRDHIFCGDVFEVCLTHRLEAALAGSAWELYQILRHINPAPFAAWLQCGDFQIACASPERFLNLNADRIAESRPIKGTRPRSHNPAEDQALSVDLATSEKDRAENVMIVDLVRNDLGKVCDTGSVIVPEMLVVEKYRTVFQLVSTVQGTLKKDYDAFDLIRACFPGGSMTGAPKIEAMQIIDSQEPVTRGIYSGAMGYIDARGVMDLNIVIRTMVLKDGQATFGVGGAVVADSDPDMEYLETLDKAQALADALTIARALSHNADI